MADLEIFPEDWDRALAVVAHPEVEQIASCGIVGVDDVEFLGWPDGSIVAAATRQGDAGRTNRYADRCPAAVNDALGC